MVKGKQKRTQKSKCSNKKNRKTQKLKSKVKVNPKHLCKQHPCLTQQQAGQLHKHFIIMKGGGKKQKEIPKNNNFLAEVENNDENDFAKISHQKNDYNDNLFVRESHNCYTYFLNMKSQKAVELCKQDYGKKNICRRAQPGYYAGHEPLKENDYNCPNIMKRTFDDNPEMYVSNLKDKCDPKYYKGAVVVAPGRDYHYYRQDDDGSGYWSHKAGYKKSSVVDSNNNLIKDPKKAARDYGGTLNYKDFCGYVCVPRSSRRKNMAYRGELQNRYNNTLKSHMKTQENSLRNPTPHNRNATIKKLGMKVRNILTRKN